MKTYNVGLLGFGFIGRVHAYGHMNLPLFLDPPPCLTKITHVVSGSEASAKKGASILGAAKASTDYREVTENPEIDIVDICSPNACHKEQLLSAIRHGKHIYCEKPLVSNAAEADEIEEALNGYGGISQMALHSRFWPAVMRAKQLVDGGFLGELLEFRAQYLHSGSADPSAPLKWKLSKAAGGGVISDLGPHVLDLACHLAGEPASLCAETSIAYKRRPDPANPGGSLEVDAEDCVMALLRTAGGAIGTIEASKIATGSEDELRIELHGSKGGIRFNSMKPHCLEAYHAEAPDKPYGGLRGWTRIDSGQRYPAPACFPGPKFSIGWLRAHLGCLHNFLDAVAAGRQASPSIAHGLKLQRLLETLRASAERRQWIETKTSNGE